MRLDDATNGIRFAAAAALGLIAVMESTTSAQQERKDVPRLGNGAFSSAAFSPDGRYLLTTSGHHARTGIHVQLWDAQTGTELRRFEGHTERVVNAVFSPDAKQILTGGGGEHAMTIPKDTSARLWDVDSGKELQRLQHGALVYTTLFSPDGEQVLTVSKENNACLWEKTRGRLLFRFNVYEDLYHQDRYLDVFAPASFSPDGHKILGKTRQRGYVATIWDAKTSKEVARIAGDSRGLRTAIFSPNGDLILTASSDRTARTWSIETGEPVQEFRGHEGTVSSAVFLKNGERVVTASLDRTVRLWDAKTGAELKRFTHPGEVKYALISADGARILAKWETVGLNSQRNYYATLWDAQSGAEIKQFPLRQNSSIAILSPSGDQILVTTDRTTLLDAKTGNIIHEYE